MSQGGFDYKSNCFLCGCKMEKIRQERTRFTERDDDVFSVRSFTFHSVMYNVCNDRNDGWGVTVKGTMEFVGDLYAADAGTTRSVASISVQVNRYRFGIEILKIFHQSPNRKADQKMYLRKACSRFGVQTATGQDSQMT